MACLRTIALLIGLLAGPLCRTLGAQTDSVSRSLNQPVTPFRMIGNLYYIGASDVTSFLIATSAGLIVLDGGFAETAPQILGNIRALGFDPHEVRILLNSHAHYDHAGGLAELKKATAAPVHAGRGDSALLGRGGKGDFFFGDRLPFPPVIVDHAVGDGHRIVLGEDTLLAIATPGHTRGCTTWSTTIRDRGRAYAALFICSLSNPGYDLRDDPPYPGIARDYQASIHRLQRLPCDVFVAPHGSQFGFQAKAERARSTTGRSPFIDPEGCRAYLDQAASTLSLP